MIFREVGNVWALEEAKRNLRQYYFLVGVTEELEDFIQVLQSSIPRFFRGAHEYFINRKDIQFYLKTWENFRLINSMLIKYI